MSSILVTGLLRIIRYCQTSFPRANDFIHSLSALDSMEFMRMPAVQYGISLKRALQQHERIRNFQKSTSHAPSTILRQQGSVKSYRSAQTKWTVLISRKRGECTSQQWSCWTKHYHLWSILTPLWPKIFITTFLKTWCLAGVNTKRQIWNPSDCIIT